MKDLNEFRSINDIEKEIILKSLTRNSSKIPKILSEIEYQLFISLNAIQQKFPKMFLVPKEFKEIICEQNKNSEIISAGLYFGFIKKGEFLLSLEGAEYFHKLDAFSKNQIIKVNINGEKSILYGNNVLKEVILETPQDLKKNDFLLVFNQSNELIAIALSKCDYLTSRNLKPKGLFALNLTDKGYYLRKKQLKKKN